MKLSVTQLRAILRQHDILEVSLRMGHLEAIIIFIRTLLGYALSLLFVSFHNCMKLKNSLLDCLLVCCWCFLVDSGVFFCMLVNRLWAKDEDTASPQLFLC